MHPQKTMWHPLIKMSISVLSGILLVLIAAGCSCPAKETKPVSENTDSAQTPDIFANTAWQLVQFQGNDGKITTPGDRSKYTLDFTADGRVAARLDCNRGSGSWKAPGPESIELGIMALTRAMCLDPGLSDQIAGHWQQITAYSIKDGHLFLVVKDNGGVYEFEPAQIPQR